MILILIFYQVLLSHFGSQFDLLHDSCSIYLDCKEHEKEELEKKIKEGVFKCVKRLEGGRKLCGRVTGRADVEEDCVRTLWFDLLDVMVQSVTTCRKWFEEGAKNEQNQRFFSFHSYFPPNFLFFN